MARQGNQRTFGKNRGNNPETTDVVTDENTETVETEVPETTEGNSEMSTETVTTENTEVTETVETPAFDIDNLPSTGVEMIDSVTNNVVSRIKDLRKLSDELSKNSNLTNDSEVLNFAKSEDADATVKSLFESFEELQKSLAERFDNLKVAVLSAKGITPLSTEKVAEKNTEFETIRTKAIAGVEGLKSLTTAFDNMPEGMADIVTNLRAEIPVLPGQRKSSGGTKQDAGGSKPRLGNGFIKINGETVGKNIAPAVKILNGKLPSGSPEITVENFISGWLTATGKSKWQDAPEDSSFEISGVKVEIKFLPKNPGA